MPESYRLKERKKKCCGRREEENKCLWTRNLETDALRDAVATRDQLSCCRDSPCRLSLAGSPAAL